MALQHSAVLEEHILQCVGTGHRRFVKELAVPCKYTLKSIRQLINKLKLLTSTGNINTLFPILVVKIMNHIFHPIIQMPHVQILEIYQAISSMNQRIFKH